MMLIGASVISIGFGACKTMNNTKKGVLIGAGAGGVVGAGVGKAAGNTAVGAIVGAAVGGVTGGIIGRNMDKQAKEMESIPGAKVERVGEGINVTFDSGVLFPTDGSSVSSGAQGKLDELATILAKYPDTYVLVEGHTDATGTRSYNKKLSHKRAASVSEYLKERNIKDSRVRSAWYGEDQPKYPNDTDANMAQNRRVEFAIYANEEGVRKAKEAAGS
nr:OmpA family protein [Flavihumibacter fluvii]